MAGAASHLSSMIRLSARNIERPITDRDSHVVETDGTKLGVLDDQ